VRRYDLIEDGRVHFVEVKARLSVLLGIPNDEPIAFELNSYLGTHCLINGVLVVHGVVDVGFDDLFAELHRDGLVTGQSVMVTAHFEDDKRREKRDWV
jgi:hypothetical protein